MQPDHTSKWRTSRFDQSDEAEPLGPLANLVDLMLVFACGLIAALVAISPDLIQHLNEVQSAKKSGTTQEAEVTLQQEMAKLPEKGASGSGTEGMESLGQVYRDPQSGKLILIKP